MSTSNPINADDFQALEEKVLRAVEVLRREREARAAAEAATVALETQLAQLQTQMTDLQAERSAAAESAAAELDVLRRERAHIRQRVETMLQQMDDLL